MVESDPIYEGAVKVIQTLAPKGLRSAEEDTAYTVALELVERVIGHKVACEAAALLGGWG